MALEVTLRPLKAPVIHGRDGVSRKGQDVGQASHYYSFTRMDTMGRLTIDGETFEVTGTRVRVELHDSVDRAGRPLDLPEETAIHPWVGQGPAYEGTGRFDIGRGS